MARVSRPVTVAGQRAAALRFADPVVLALLSVLVVFRLLPDGWRHRDLGSSFLVFAEEQSCCLVRRRGQTSYTPIVQTALFRGSPGFAPQRHEVLLAPEGQPDQRDVFCGNSGTLRVQTVARLGCLR